MADKDYYKLLGISKSATKEEIKKAYKKLAMQFHPDRAPEDKKKEYEEKFKEISEAAAILGDDKKRQQYDQFGSSAFAGGGAGGAGHGFSGFEGFDFSRAGGFGSINDFDDLFEQIFSGGGGSGSRGRYTTRARRGADLLYELEISLEEAASGAEKTISLNKLERCSACSGKGATSFEHCRECKGSGYLKVTRRTPFGLFQQTSPCPECRGVGEQPIDSCQNCDGEGLIRNKKKIEVSIPAGVDEGTRLRVRNEGEIGENGGPPGDLYVQIHVAEHPVFERRGDDLHVTLPISFTQAIFGDEIEVPTIEGKAILKVPPRTDSETIFRMQEKGIPHLQEHGRGDQMVKVRIEVPKKLSKKQQDLIKQLHEEKPSKGLFTKIFG